MIRVRGPWMWAWAANIAMMWALVFFGSLFDKLFWGLIWAGWFAVQEGLGTYINNKTWNEPELARTFSQVMQFFAWKDKGSNWYNTFTGWDLFVTGNCVIAGVLAGTIVDLTWNLGLGILIGVIVSGWNYGHWHNRNKHG